MENIGSSLKVRCAAAGTTLTEVCARAGVTPATIRNWAKEEPMSIKKYREVVRVIEEIEQEKAALNAQSEAISE